MHHAQLFSNNDVMAIVLYRPPLSSSPSSPLIVVPRSSWLVFVALPKSDISPTPEWRFDWRGAQAEERPPPRDDAEFMEIHRVSLEALHGLLRSGDMLLPSIATCYLALDRLQQRGLL